MRWLGGSTVFNDISKRLGLSCRPIEAVDIT